MRTKFTKPRRGLRPPEEVRVVVAVGRFELLEGLEAVCNAELRAELAETPEVGTAWPVCIAFPIVSTWGTCVV